MTISLSTDLIARAQAWMAADPKPADREEIAALLAAARAGQSTPEQTVATAELTDRFAGALEFGTAGLRGAIAAGPNRMNVAVVTTAAAGLCQVLREDLGAGFHVVIGYDARHGSAEFAETTAAVVIAAGGKASLLPRELPTPVLAFALRHLQADAGVMVTASHNPPADNGYKVYLGGRMVTGAGQGAQIVAPMDRRIFTAIEAIGGANTVPLAPNGWEIIGEDVISAYVDRAVSLLAPGPRDLRIVLTSMHGVGAEVCERALAEAGFTDVHPVAAQRDPDPEFSTVKFPNPEEPGALDLAISLAQEVQADIIIANDPDADRCSAAIPDASAPGGYRQLTGDEVGSLLGELVASEHRGEGTKATLASSIVSSALLGKIAADAGVQYTPTLTGFKWISRAEGLAFGYEEALGYCVDPAAVRDKDGISATLRLAELAAQMKTAGSSLQDRLDDLAHRFGLHVTAPLSFRVADLSLISGAMARLRSGGAPTRLAGAAVVSTDDLSAGWQGLPATDALIYLNERGDRVVVRPSGTEPKLKCYLEVVVAVETLPAARAEAAKRIAAMKADMTAALGL